MFKRLKEATDHNYGFWISLIVSILLFIGGALTPPMFVIDKTIFIAVAELFSFASLGAVYKALDKNQSASIKKGDVELTIGDKKDEGTQE